MTHTTPRKFAHTQSRKLDDQEPRGPRTATINTILGYSKACQMVDAPPVGEIALVLN